MACPVPWHLVDCYRFDFTSHSVQVWWDSKPKPSSSLLCYDFYSTTCLCQFYDNTYTPAIHLTYKGTSSMTKTSRKSRTQERKQHIHTLHIFWHISFTSHVGHCWRSHRMFGHWYLRGIDPHVPINLEKRSNRVPKYLHSTSVWNHIGLYPTWDFIKSFLWQMWKQDRQLIVKSCCRRSVWSRGRVSKERWKRWRSRWTSFVCSSINRNFLTCPTLPHPSFPVVVRVTEEQEKNIHAIVNLYLLFTLSK